MVFLLIVVVISKQPQNNQHNPRKTANPLQNRVKIASNKKAPNGAFLLQRLFFFTFPKP